LLGKWFGRRPAPPTHLTAAIEDVEKLARNRPSLQRSCKVLATLVVELFAEPATDKPPLLAAEDAQAKLAEGIPLLRGVPAAASLQLAEAAPSASYKLAATTVTVDETAFRRRFLAVCAAMQQKDGEVLADEVCEKNLDPISLLGEVLSGRPETVSMQAEAHGLDPSLVATVLRLTALPVLARFAEDSGHLRQGLRWEYGYCPTCGSWPLLAEARGLEQLRFLRCGLCGTAWEGGRFRCLYCGNQDHRSLGYFHVEGEEDRLRAATCDVCHGYVKVISTLSALSLPHLLIADLSSLHLDLAAADRGFFVPAVA
jgi:FdhE protein